MTQPTTPTYAELLQYLAPGELKQVYRILEAARCYRQITFALDTATRQMNQHPGTPITENAVICGILNAVEDSGIDFSDSTCEAEITATLLAYLAAGRRALDQEGGAA